MKNISKSISIIALVFFTINSHGQNIFPSTGNVGIGTTNPKANLHIDGNEKHELLISGASPNISLINIESTDSSIPAMLGISGGNGEFFSGTVFGDLILKGQSDGSILFATNPANSSPALERMRITNDGNIGIGVVAPESKLHIDGTITTPSFKTNERGVIKIRNFNAGENQYNRALFPTYDATTNTSKLVINKNSDFEDGVHIEGPELLVDGNLGVGTTTPYTKLHITGGTDTNLSGGGFITTGYLNNTNISIDNNEIQARNNGAASNLFLQNGGGNLIINSDGNVGIGTTNPQAKLHIADGANANLSGGGYITAGPLNSHNVVIDINEVQARNNGNTASLHLQPKGGNLIIHHNGNDEEKVFVRANGEVAIGTTDTRGYKLAVNGNVLAEELKIRTFANWPDYVFEENYHLKSLTELEKEINTLGHLPNIPSVKEVKEDGFNVGEMNAKLLEKIEELTLYIITLDKELKTVKEELKMSLDITSK